LTSVTELSGIHQREQLRQVASYKSSPRRHVLGDCCLNDLAVSRRKISALLDHADGCLYGIGPDVRQKHGPMRLHVDLQALHDRGVDGTPGITFVRPHQYTSREWTSGVSARSLVSLAT
jgi:hypothetical protein